MDSRVAELLSTIVGGDFARGQRTGSDASVIGTFATGQATRPTPVLVAIRLPD